MDALNEAAKVGSQQYYKTAQKTLTDIKNMLRPFLTGAKDFTAKDLDDISSLLNDENVSAVLGKNDKKALKAIQNVNGMIKNKKAALAQTQQTDTAANKGTTEKIPPAKSHAKSRPQRLPGREEYKYYYTMFCCVLSMKNRYSFAFLQLSIDLSVFARKNHNLAAQHGPFVPRKAVLLRQMPYSTWGQGRGAG